MLEVYHQFTSGDSHNSNIRLVGGHWYSLCLATERLQAWVGLRYAARLRHQALRYRPSRKRSMAWVVRI